MSAHRNAADQESEIQSVHPGDLAVFIVTTSLCILCALMLPLVG